MFAYLHIIIWFFDVYTFFISLFVTGELCRNLAWDTQVEQIAEWAFV